MVLQSSLLEVETSRKMAILWSNKPLYYVPVYHIADKQCRAGHDLSDADLNFMKEVTMENLNSLYLCHREAASD